MGSVQTKNTNYVVKNSNLLSSQKDCCKNCKNCSRKLKWDSYNPIYGLST